MTQCEHFIISIVSFLPLSPSFLLLSPFLSPSFSSYPVRVKSEIEEEEKAIAKLDQQVREMERRISKQRKEMGG